MSVVYAPTSKLLRYADRARTDDTIRDVDLWQLADRDARGIEARVRMYRHALIHAGRLPGRSRLVRCPDCDARLL